MQQRPSGLQRCLPGLGYQISFVTQLCLLVGPSCCDGLSCCCRLQDALQDFSAAISTDPTAALSFSSRALLLERLGRPEAALADHDAAVTLDPSDPGYVKARGLCHRSLGQYDAAAQDFGR